MLVSRRDLLISAAALFPLRAQEKTDAKYASGVNVVNVFASVHNSKNEVVKDLKQEDFTIEEDGRPQTIKYFARETDLPLTIGLMIDTSGSQRRVLGQEKTATSDFISQVMREDKDKAFLIKFDAEAEEMQELTSSKKKLQSALNDVEGASPRQLQRRNDPNSTSGGGGGGNQRAGTILYDAILLASNEEMKKLQGRKAMILLTDGDDHGSRTSLSECIESAQRADTIIYSIYFADQEQSNFNPGFGGPGMGRHGGGGGGRNRQQVSRGDGKKILQRISKETGGSYFEVTKKLSIDKIYQQIEEELRSQYNLGYTPDKSDAGSGFRKIKVTAKGKGLVVQARDGYYATT
ncbi:MAG TPA: VWA domain-containing protein [Bryobacteraceae bacterium]|jgi:VWFA-related protein|nr:VWA domain-containing protein [Bryobacteraceae bacterium]